MSYKSGTHEDGRCGIDCACRIDGACVLYGTGDICDEYDGICDDKGTSYGVGPSGWVLIGYTFAGSGAVGDIGDTGDTGDIGGTGDIGDIGIPR